MSHRFRILAARASALFVALSLVAGFLPSASAAPTVIRPKQQLLRQRGAEPVSRGDFLRATVKALGISTNRSQTSLPYTGRIAAGYRPAIQALHAKGALKAFNKDIGLAQPITVGEAAMVFAALHPDITPKSEATFRDVRGKDAQRAAALALEKEWLEPQSMRLFGWTRKLKAREALHMLDDVRKDIEIIEIEIRDTRTDDEKLMESVKDLLKDSFLYKDRLSTGTGTLEDFVKGLKDPYTEYMPPSATESFDTQLRGEVEGIGANVEMTGGLLRIVTPLKGSPAEKAGLQPKDHVLSVDGVPLAGLSLHEAVNKIRGKKGTTVTLRIRRGTSEFDVTLTRDTVRIPEMDVTMHGDIAVVHVLQFGEITDREISTTLKDVQAQNPKGIVLDLRSNPGGLLHASGMMAGAFLPKNSAYASISTRDTTRLERTQNEPVVHAALPVVVLVNAGTASASEIVAGALQDAGRASIIGEKTYGKGTVQQIVHFDDGSSLKITIAEWKTPQGRKIDGVGIQPDELVLNTVQGQDTQLERALQKIRGY